jgi:hypothetical protein
MAINTKSGITDVSTIYNLVLKENWAITNVTRVGADLLMIILSTPFTMQHPACACKITLAPNRTYATFYDYNSDICV